MSFLVVNRTNRAFAFGETEGEAVKVLAESGNIKAGDFVEVFEDAEITAFGDVITKEQREAAQKGEQ